MHTRPNISLVPSKEQKLGQKKSGPVLSSTYIDGPFGGGGASSGIYLLRWHVGERSSPLFYEQRGKCHENDCALMTLAALF